RIGPLRGSASSRYQRKANSSSLPRRRGPTANGPVCLESLPTPTRETPMAKTKGPGKFFMKVDPLSKVVRVWLFNFDVDSAIPKEEHRGVLSTAVGPVIRDGGSLKLLGLASTTGQAKHDQKLSEERARQVLNFLRTKFGNQFTVAKEIALGK